MLRKQGAVAGVRLECGERIHLMKIGDAVGQAKIEASTVLAEDGRTAPMAAACSGTCAGHS